MTIIIDAYQAAPHITGSDRLAYNMLRELQALDTANKYIIMVNANHSFITSGISAPNFEVYKVTASKRAIWLTFRLPFILLRLKADVFYSFHNLSSPGFKTCRTIVSLLDMIPVEKPDLYFGSTKFTLRRLIVTHIMQRSVKVADEFTAISRYSKDIAVRQLAIPASKIQVIYLQADPQFFVTHSKAELETTVKRYNLPKQFVLTIGGSEPRKNVVSAIAAHRLLAPALRNGYPLIIAGAKWHNQEVSLDGDSHIRLTGFIDDADLPRVYALATAFVFPSTYEGFGLPVLEAMASHTPVASSNATSLPEVTGEAALTFDPLGTKAIAGVLSAILTNTKLRDSLRHKGDGQVAKFSWAKSAAELQKLLTA